MRRVKLNLIKGAKPLKEITVMKKKLVALLTMMTVLACLMLTACSLGTAGTYKFKSASVTVLGQTKELTAEDVDDYAETSIVLNKDKTYTIMLDDKEEDKGTWVKDGKTITLTSDLTKQSIEFAVDGKTITLSITEDGEGFKIVYEKQ